MWSALANIEISVQIQPYRNLENQMIVKGHNTIISNNSYKNNQGVISQNHVRIETLALTLR